MTEGGFMGGHGICEELLPYYLVYWDEILLLETKYCSSVIVLSDFSIPIFAYELNPDYERLVNAFILNRYLVFNYLHQLFDEAWREKVLASKSITIDVSAANVAPRVVVGFIDR